MSTRIKVESDKMVGVAESRAVTTIPLTLICKAAGKGISTTLE